MASAPAKAALESPSVVLATTLAEDEAKAKDEAAEFRSTSPHGISLHGTLTDSRGGPIRLDDLLVRDDLRGLVFGEEDLSYPGHASLGTTLRSPLSTTIDQQGQFSFVDLRPGTYTLFADFPFYRPGGSEIVLAATDVDRRIDVALEPFNVLHVRVEVALDAPLDDPRGFKGRVHDNQFNSTVRVIVIRDGDPEGDDPEADHSLTGRVATKEECDGPMGWRLRESIVLKGELPVVAALAVGNRVLQRRQVHSTVEEVVFAVTLDELRSSLGGVQFRIFDAEGRKPETPGMVMLARSAGAESAYENYVDHGGSNESPWIAKPGEVRLRGLHPGPVGIQVSVPGFAPLQVETVVEPHVDRDLGAFLLERCLTIRGFVVNPDGTPADADVEYVAVGDAADGASIFQPEVRVTDSRGHFAIYDAGPGRFRLRATSQRETKWASMPKLFTARAGESVDGIVIQLLQRTEVMVKLEKPPKGSITMRIEDASGLLVEEQPAAVLKRGAVAAFELCPGAYTARAVANGKEVGNLGFTVVEEPLRLTLNPR